MPAGLSGTVSAAPVLSVKGFGFSPLTFALIFVADGQLEDSKAATEKLPTQRGLDSWVVSFQTHNCRVQVCF